MHPPLRVAVRHLLMHDAASGGHPLDVARAEVAAIAEAVAMLHLAREHIGDGLDAAVRMPGEAGQIVVRVLVPEIVEEQERIELGRVAESERAPQLDARAFDVGLRLESLASLAGSTCRAPS